MGAFQKYYLSFLAIAAIGLLLAGATPGFGRTAGVVVLLALAAYMVFIRCPKAGRG